MKKKKYEVHWETYDRDVGEVECYLSQDDVRQIEREIDGMEMAIYEYETVEGEIITSDRILSLEIK